MYTTYRLQRSAQSQGDIFAHLCAILLYSNVNVPYSLTRKFATCPQMSGDLIQLPPCRVEYTALQSAHLAPGHLLLQSSSRRNTPER